MQHGQCTLTHLCNNAFADSSTSKIGPVHGGLSPSYVNLAPYPSAINNLGQTLLGRLQRRRFPDPHPPAPYAGLPEGASEAGSNVMYATTGSGSKVLGGIGQYLAHKLYHLTHIDARVTVLGHLQEVDSLILTTKF